MDESPQVKLEKKTSLKYKIDPQVPYYPVCDGVTMVQMINIHTLFNSYKFEEADAADNLNVDSSTEEKDMV